MAQIKQNLHTHSLYDDGKDSIADMVQKAQELGFSLLGFSGHGWNPEDEGSMSPEGTRNYMEDVRQAQKSAPESLKILLGIEEDSISPVDPEPYDYVIGSVHYLEKGGKYYPVDYSQEQFRHMLETGWNNDIHALIHDYYQAVAAQANNERAQIIGHIDLIAKYNEMEEWFRFDDPYVLQESEKAVQALARAGKIFEMNTGAIARGYRSAAYPSDPILHQIAQAGGKLMINTDCHDRENLDLGIQECVRRAKTAGFQELYTFEEGAFIPKPISQFEEKEA